MRGAGAGGGAPALPGGRVTSTGRPDVLQPRRDEVRRREGVAGSTEGDRPWREGGGPASGRPGGNDIPPDLEGGTVRGGGQAMAAEPDPAMGGEEAPRVAG